MIELRQLTKRYGDKLAVDGISATIPLSGAGSLSAGEIPDSSIDVPFGRYVFVCYIANPDDGAPHFMKGMISVVTVV